MRSNKLRQNVLYNDYCTYLRNQTVLQVIFKLCTTHLIDSYYIKIIIYYSIPEYPRDQNSNTFKETLIPLIPSYVKPYVKFLLLSTITNVYVTLILTFFIIKQQFVIVTNVTFYNIFLQFSLITKDPFISRVFSCIGIFISWILKTALTIMIKLCIQIWFCMFTCVGILFKFIEVQVS